MAACSARAASKAADYRIHGREHAGGPAPMGCRFRAAAQRAIEYRRTECRNERFAEIVAELVRLKVDVIVTQGTPAVLAAKQATSVIPVVFAIAGNPVANGLASLGRPGGNVTGLSRPGRGSTVSYREIEHGNEAWYF